MTGQSLTLTEDGDAKGGRRRNQRVHPDILIRLSIDIARQRFESCSVPSSLDQVDILVQEPSQFRTTITR